MSSVNYLNCPKIMVENEVKTLQSQCWSVLSFLDIQEIPSVSRLVTDPPAGQTEGENSLPSNLSWSSTEDCEAKQLEEQEEEENGPSVLRRLSPNILFSLQSPGSSERTSRTTSRPGYFISSLEINIFPGSLLRSFFK